jgi:GT2 family glycosyltransferase
MSIALAEAHALDLPEPSMSAAPRASVIVCTRDRPRLLAGAIDSVLSQQTREPFEVLVVDNGRRPDTEAIVRRYSGRVDYVRERRAGLSHARNAGWTRARSDIIILLDDDAVARPGWLAALLDAFESTDAACVGGRVLPVWESPRPDWLSDDLVPSLTVADWSETAHAVADLRNEWLVGANIAFRRSVLSVLGGFAPDLGRKGRRLLSGEETFLQRRLIAEGHTCWYEPSAIVDHAVPAARLTPGWFRRRYFAQGVSDARMWRTESRAGRLQRFSRGAREAMTFATRPGSLSRLTPGSVERSSFTAHCGALWELGFVSGLFGIA